MIRVRTHRQTVLINTNFWPRVQHPRPYCTTITSGSVLFHSGFYTFPVLLKFCRGINKNIVLYSPDLPFLSEG